MPEGPSIVILREAVEALNLTKKPVIEAEGTARIDMDQLINQKVITFKSWGKHFLICFEKSTLRIHLMLFGSYLINERKKTKPKLSIRFSKDELNFYACSVKLIDEPADKLYDWTGDIMSDKWKPANALKKLAEMPDALACDVLLNQDIFSGSGNIIKNEVLFRTRIHPLSSITKIPEKKLKEMISETRKYAFDFLNWKKEGTLKKHWLAHTKQICPRDHVAFQKEYMGKNKRRSYFCELCQKLYN